MKKVLVLFLTLIIICASFPISTFAAEDKWFDAKTVEYYKNLGLQGTTVNVYNWGEYISDGDDDSMNVIEEFERLTGAKVNYSNFESNENLYSKLSGGGVSYDVVIPSDYMIERLKDEKMLEKLDYNNIPNYKYIIDECKNLYFDSKNEYTVCYNVGTTVLIYNKKFVKEKPTSWKILWDKKYQNKVLMFNNSRDAFAIAQAILGQDFNSTNEQDIHAAAELLAKQREDVNPEYVMDEIFNKMGSGEYALATYYAGDYELLYEDFDNKDLGYCFPNEGVNAFYDAMCIPKCYQNKKGAEAFINFMEEPEVALQNAEYIYYASPNKAVRENPDYSLFGNECIYPKVQPTSQYFKNLPQNILELQANLWIELKRGTLNDNGSNSKIYISSAVVGGVAILVVALKLISNIKKKKEEDLSDLY